MKNKDLHNKTEDFKIPESYFSDFEDNLWSQIELGRVLPDKEGFVIPDGYLNGIEERVLNQLSSDPYIFKGNQQAKYRRLYFAIGAIAASLVLTLTLTGILNNTSKNSSVGVLELQNYVENGYHLLNAYDLVDVFETDVLEDISMENKIDDDVLLEYLINNADPSGSLNTEE